jgi:transposase
MNDTKLYEQILGLVAPWSVKSVTLKKDEGVIEVEVACEETVWGCPKCGRRMHIHEWDRRRWRHLDSCQYKTMVVADVPRVKCDLHGSQMVNVPWAEPRSRFTAWFERLGIDVLQECSTAAACDILRITWDEADGIKQRAIDRGLARRKEVSVQRLCIDEKAVGWGHQYVTIVSGVEGGKARVLAIEDDRKENSLNRFWRTLTPGQRLGVETVAMDMWEAFRNSTIRYVPGAVDKIVYDNFHLARYMNRAVDEVRRTEHAVRQGDGLSPLKGTRQLWLYGLENVPRKWARRFRELRELATKTARAWKVKELLRSFWACTDTNDATQFFRKWYREAMATHLEPVKKVARMFKKHWANIVTYFRHHLSNATAEGINSRIQQLIQQACGYRNRARFKRDVLFHLGALDLYPSITQ